MLLCIVQRNRIRTNDSYEPILSSESNTATSITTLLKLFLRYILIEEAGWRLSCCIVFYNKCLLTYSSLSAVQLCRLVLFMSKKKIIYVTWLGMLPNYITSIIWLCGKNYSTRSSNGIKLVVPQSIFLLLCSMAVDEFQSNTPLENNSSFEY